MSRPTIRQDDSKGGLTEYAKAYGPRQSGRKPGLWRHSTFTPTDPLFQLDAHTAQDNEEDEAFQTMVYGYTTNELVLQGAYNPRLVIPPVDLQEPVHDLFARRRWKQNKKAQPWTNDWPGMFDVRYGSELDSVGGVFDAINNQRL